MKKKLAITVGTMAFALNVSVASVSAAAEPGITSSAITIGSAYPLTGPLSPYYKGYFSGAKAYFDYVNANGGIFGRQITWATADSKGLANLAMSVSANLLLENNVFAFFNNAPGCSNHIAVANSLRIVDRGIPDIASECVLPELSGADEPSSPNRLGTTFSQITSGIQESKIMGQFLKDTFPTISFDLQFIDDDLGAAGKDGFQKVKYVFKSSKGSARGAPMFAISASTASAGTVLFGDGSFWIKGVNSSVNPLVLRGVHALNLLSIPGAFLPAQLTNAYATFAMPLPDDESDPYINLFSQIRATYAPSAIFDQNFIFGANNALMLAQGLAGAGPNPTRTNLIQVLENFGSTFSTAAYSSGPWSPKKHNEQAGMFVAKFNGSKWVKVSDYYFADNDSGVVTKVQINRPALVSRGLPIMVSKVKDQAPSTDKPTPSTDKPIAPQISPPTQEDGNSPEVSDGVEEEPSATLKVNKDKTGGYLISISSNIASDPLVLRATKKGLKSIVFNFETKESGSYSFRSTRNLSGYLLTLSYQGQALTTIKV